MVFLIIDAWKLLAFQSVNPINVIPETGRVHLIRYLRLFEDYWIDSSDGGLFFIQDVIHHVISVTEPLHCIQDNFSGNFDSFPLISPSDIFCINELTLILTII